MYEISGTNQTNQNESILFFDSNPTPFISLINLLFNKDNKIEFLENIESKSETTLESKKARFVYTKKYFVFNISKQDNEWLIHFQLSGSETLTEEEKDICKYYMEQLNSIGFCFYIDNEDDTFEFDQEIYSQQPKKEKNKFFIQDDYWTNITNKMKELNLPDNIKQRIRVQRSQLEKKYGKEEYKTYFDTYFEKQLQLANNTESKSVQQEPITIQSNNITWEQITKRMKELKMPSNLMNRMRVQRWHLMNKYGDDYINYIGEYAEKQFNDYINKQN